MSRCFTSTPPMYSRNWANGQNLVESTKIGKEIVASKKVHRKEKKEKRKENKLKNDKSSKQHYFQAKQVVSDESEQLEKSCVTEEHEQQHHVGYLSDGSQNSKKRRREASPAVESNIKATPVAGKPLRIRFVFKKPKEADVVLPLEDPVCSTSASVITSSISNSKTSELEQNLLSIPSEPKKRSKHKPSKESRYNTLFDELVRPCISLEEDNSNSEDWLSCTRRQENVSTKSSIKTDEDMFMNSHISGDSLLPRAQFLSEVGIFALPYTVLF